MHEMFVFRKRKSATSDTSAESTSAEKRPCVSGVGDVASGASHDNTDEDCVDDKQLVRNTMIVRLPTQAPNALPSSVIVIDDSDDDADTTSDIKPDVRQLDQQLVESSAADVDRKPPAYVMIAQQTNHVAPEHTVSESSPAECNNQMSAQSVAGVGSGNSQACASSHRGVENIQNPEHSRQMLGQSVAGAAIGNSQACSSSHNSIKNIHMLVQSAAGAGDGNTQTCSSTCGAAGNIQTPEHSRQMFGQSVGGAGSGNAQHKSSSHVAGGNIQTSKHSCQMLGQSVGGTGSGNAQACSSSHSPVEDGGYNTPSFRPHRRLSKSTQSATPTHVQNQKATEMSSGEKSAANKYVQSKIHTQDVTMQTEVRSRDVTVQTEACSSSAEGQLESLRSNVLQLLKTIVPTLTCNNLEFVDELVVEMVRVNADNSEVGD